MHEKHGILFLALLLEEYLYASVSYRQDYSLPVGKQLYQFKENGFSNYRVELILICMY